MLINDIVELSKSEKGPQGISRQSLNSDIKTGKIKGFKNGGIWVFKYSEVERYLKNKKGIS